MHACRSAALCLLTVIVWSQTAIGQITAQPAPAVRPVFNPGYTGYGGYSTAPPLMRPTASGSAASGSAASGLDVTASILQSPEANSIRGWYRDYLGRDVGSDLTALSNLLRGGMSTTDLQATILGSDEFYSQKGRDPQTFVRETLQAVTWSEPSYADVQRWTARLAQLRNDRFALAREILLDSQSPQGETQAWREVTARLPAAARLAIDTIQFEIAGTPQGRQANLQAVALLDAVNRLDQLPSNARAADVLSALDGADRSLTALSTTLSNPPGAAPSAASVARRIGTMLTETRTVLSPTGSTPRPTSALPADVPKSDVSPSSPDAWSWKLADQISSARRAAESLIQVLTSQAYQDYTYNTVLRDLDTLASRLANLESLARSSASRERLALEVQSLGDSAQRIETQLGGGRLPYTARLYWQSLQSSLAQLRETTGAAGGSTVLRPTAWHESLLPMLDQAAAQIEVFLAGTSPLIYQVAEVPSVQADARSLKSRVMLLREQAGNGQPAAVLKQTLAGMVGDYQSAFDRWNRIVAANRLQNPARLSPVGETLNRVERIINEALGTGGTPGTTSAVGAQLAQLTGEVTEARRSLTAFAGYREQQSMDLYLEQLAGYIQQLNDATARQSPGDARRLAVGMQSVVGHLQTDFEALTRQATASLVVSQVSELRSRVQRIGQLVDQIEAALY